ncbi:enhancer of yellow 2 transcription factor [Halyomorpha halys]|uniref:enhancer of yellow 2 transcription factor n=1 Tax=Halyomorpha halys TaxID=286706 RepID=UPI0006D4E0CA|nr:enhancer of yellow 2 transcription factor-like [Halyomorpha halys]
MTLDSSSEQLALLKVTGDYNRFKDLLRTRLYECGWVDQIHMMCRDTKRNSVDVTHDELFNEVAKKGRALVPASVKRELLLKVKEKLLHTAGYYDD